jgi:molybdopterin molybdotransferase
MTEPIPIEEARRRVLDAVEPLGAEDVALDDALGRVLAETVSSSVSVPPFDGSAMDGFAVPGGARGELRIVGESRAGRPYEGRLEPGTAVAISTGAVVPEGAGAVVPIEQAEVSGQAVTVGEPGEGDNIRRAGEDVRPGDELLAAGTELSPGALGVLASVGRPTARCARRPRVAIVATGDELAGPGAPLGPGQIWSSNATALAAQVRLAGGSPTAAADAADEPGQVRDAIAAALDGADVVCVSGGVSVGPHDHVKGALRELGAREAFWGVALRPGKPTWFGTAERGGRRVLAFGLPGNPVSALVTFLLFARPALRAMQGADPDAFRTTGVLAEPVGRNPRRAQAVRCLTADGAEGLRLTPTGPQGSHMLTSMLGARALALIGPGEGEAAAGERVPVELLG